MNGSLTIFESFPYQATIIKRNAWSYCGGAIISRFWVITAAHCTVSSNRGLKHSRDIKIGIGATRTKKNENTISSPLLSTKAMFTPETFRRYLRSSPCTVDMTKSVSWPLLTQKIFLHTYSFWSSFWLNKSREADFKTEAKCERVDQFMKKLIRKTFIVNLRSTVFINW